MSTDAALARTVALRRPLRLGALALAHRVVLAPLTRMRADGDSCATALHAAYYAQRASRGGLVIRSGRLGVASVASSPRSCSEAIHVLPESRAYPNTPGLWSDAQRDSWRGVAAAVHARGGLCAAQLWHTGRVASRAFGGTSRGASDVRLPRRDDEPVVPLTRAELAALPGHYRRAARHARDAGFDAVELHAAHGYLLDQFLNSKTNRRADDYGGSVANRARLLFAVVDALCAELGSQRVGVRISPHAAGTLKFYFVDDDEPDGLYAYVVEGLARRRLAYLLVTEPRWTGRAKHDDAPDKDPSFTTPLVNGPKFRSLYPGPMIGAGGFTPHAAATVVESGTYDAVAFGRWFIANPDLPARIFSGAPLNKYTRKTFYQSDRPIHEGYIDYPYDGDEDERYPLVAQKDIGVSLKAAKL